MTESSTRNMDNLINKHDGTIKTCWCELCYHARKKRLQDETDRWKKEKQILLNKIDGTVQAVVHIEETEDCYDSKWSDTESVKSLGTMTYSENESGFFGSLSDISGITEIPNDCEEQKYKLLQDELDRWRNKVVDLELKNNKLEIAEEWYVKQ